MQLSSDQEKAFNAFKEGKNILLTGPGGSGKTELIKKLVKVSPKALLKLGKLF